MFTYLFTAPYPPPSPHVSSFSPSLISLMVSVDVKHHVYLLIYSSITPPPPMSPPFSPSLISLMVSVDVKHHVYFVARSQGQCCVRPSSYNGAARLHSTCPWGLLVAVFAALRPQKP